MKDTASQSQELKNCNSAKAILMVLIVLGHSVHFWTGDWFTKNPAYQSAALAWLSNWLSGFHVYAFTAISGFIFCYLKYKNARYDRFASFLLAKFKRLVVPYFFVGVCWVSVFQILLLKYDCISVIKNILLGINPNQLWFLLMLFDVFCLSYFLSPIWVNRPIMGLVGVAGLYLLGAVATLCRVPNYFQLLNGLEHITYYYYGFMLQLFVDKPYRNTLLRRINPLFYFLLYTLLNLVWQHYGQYSSTYYKIICRVISLPLHIIGITMVFSIIVHVKEKDSGLLHSLIVALKKHSMPVYLFHQQIIFLAIYCLNGRISPYLNALWNFIIAMFFSLLLSKVFLKYGFTRQLIGEK